MTCDGHAIWEKLLISKWRDTRSDEAEDNWFGLSTDARKKDYQYWLAKSNHYERLCIFVREKQFCIDPTEDMLKNEIQLNDLVGKFFLRSGTLPRGKIMRECLVKHIDELC